LRIAEGRGSKQQQQRRSMDDNSSWQKFAFYQSLWESCFKIYGEPFTKILISFLVYCHSSSHSNVDA